MSLEETFDEDVSEDTVASGGFDLVMPGFYQCGVVNVKENEKGNYEVDMEVICGTKESEVGKVHREFFSTNNKTMNRKRRVALAIASNLTTRAEIARAREANQSLTIDYPSAVNQHIVVEIEHDEIKKLDEETGDYVGTGKETAKIPYDNIWNLEDKWVIKKGIPIDKSKVDMDPFGHPEEKSGGGDF